jgi:HEAT repeat protein
MKTRTVSATVKKAGLVILTVLLIGSTITAQDRKATLSEKNVKCLISALQHENEGVKRDAIYYAAFYNVSEAIPTLIEELRKEKNPKLRLLIALSLYKLGDPEGIEAVYQSAMSDSDAKVRRMCNSIVIEYKAAQKEVAVK